MISQGSYTISKHFILNAEVIYLMQRELFSQETGLNILIGVIYYYFFFMQDNAENLVMYL